MALVERTNLSQLTAEYQEVAREFNSRNMVNGKKLELLSIERVHNTTLEQRFLIKKQQYVQTYGHVRVVKGWHGTKQVNVAPILKDNFDVSKHGENRGARFGAGVSFSRLASYASHFCDKTGVACMILNEVLVSNIVNVPENKNPRTVLREPPFLPGGVLRYDTTAKNKERMDVFVKFEQDTFLPKHVVHFKQPARSAHPVRPARRNRTRVVDFDMLDMDYYVDPDPYGDAMLDLDIYNDDPDPYGDAMLDLDIYNDDPDPYGDAMLDLDIYNDDPDL